MNNNGSRKLLLQKQQISSADLAHVRGGDDDNTGKLVSQSVSAVISGVASGIVSIPGAPASTVPIVASAGASAAAGYEGSGAISNFVSRLSNPFNSF